MSTIGSRPFAPDIRGFRPTDTYSLPDPSSETPVTAAFSAAATAYLRPFVVSKPCTLAAVAFYCVLAGATHKVRLAIYRAATDGSGNGAKLVSDLGEVTPTTTTLMEITGLSVKLAPGLYFIASNTDNAAGDTYNTYNATSGGILNALGYQTFVATDHRVNNSWSVALTYGAYPASLAATAKSRNQLLMVMLKGAQ